MKTILITGGAGFIGSSSVLQFLQTTDAHVVNVDKLTYAGNPENLADVAGSPRYHFAQADICDGPALRSLFARYQPDAVVHLAAESHVDRSIDGPAEFLRTNLTGTGELLSASLEHWRKLPAGRRNSFRFLHVSTDEVYGDLGPEDPPFKLGLVIHRFKFAEGGTDMHLLFWLVEGRWRFMNIAPHTAMVFPQPGDEPRPRFE